MKTLEPCPAAPSSHAPGHTDLVQVNAATFQALVEKSFDAVMLLSAAGMILYASPAAERIGGWKTEKYVGTPIGQWKHPEDLAAHSAGLQELIHHPGASFTGESRLRHK